MSIYAIQSRYHTLGRMLALHLGGEESGVELYPIAIVMELAHEVPISSCGGGGDDRETL